jgi:hypothetical protein
MTNLLKIFFFNFKLKRKLNELYLKVSLVNIITNAWKRKRLFR